MQELDYRAIAKRLNERRVHLGYSFQDLADKANMSKSTLQRYETGAIKNIPIARLKALSSALEMEPNELIGVFARDPDDIPPGLRPIEKGSYVPLYGRIACGSPILAVEDLEEVAWMPDGIRADFALTCVGDSMINARIFDGDTVYVRSQPEVENGEIAAVRVNDEEVTLKRVYYYPREGRMRLEAENPTHRPQNYEGEELNHIEILGKAVAFLSPVW